MFTRGMVGITEASATRRPSTPFTRHSASTTVPMAQVPTGWKKPRTASLAWSRASTSGPGLVSRAA